MICGVCIVRQGNHAGYVELIAHELFEVQRLVVRMPKLERDRAADPEPVAQLNGVRARGIRLTPADYGATVECSDFNIG